MVLGRCFAAEVPSQVAIWPPAEVRPVENHQSHGGGNLESTAWWWWWCWWCWWWCWWCGLCADDMCFIHMTPQCMQPTRDANPLRSQTPGRLRTPKTPSWRGSPSPVIVYRAPKNTKDSRRRHERVIRRRTKQSAQNVNVNFTSSPRESKCSCAPCTVNPVSVVQPARNTLSMN